MERARRAQSAARTRRGADRSRSEPRGCACSRALTTVNSLQPRTRERKKTTTHTQKNPTRSHIALSDRLPRTDPLAEMAAGRLGAQTPGPVAPLSRSFLCIVLLLTSWLTVCEAFNLDVESPTVYSGPAGSYFGYAVDFYLVNPSR